MGSIFLPYECSYEFYEPSDASIKIPSEGSDHRMCVMRGSMHPVSDQMLEFQPCEPSYKIS
jgi:hypothetical protein